ncbi:hypothetical protein BH11PSE11_BH11PSE11_16630 [soil metagenome]
MRPSQSAKTTRRYQNYRTILQKVEAPGQLSLVFYARKPLEAVFLANSARFHCLIAH